MSRFLATPAPTTVILCRHGESEWNVAQRIQGQSPAAGGLTPIGRVQARLRGRRLKSTNVDVLISSDLRRALETALIAGTEQGLPPALDPHGHSPSGSPGHCTGRRARSGSYGGYTSVPGSGGVLR